MVSEFIRIEKTICENYMNYLSDKYDLTKDEKFNKLEEELSKYMAIAISNERAHSQYNKHVIVATAAVLEVLDIKKTDKLITRKEREFMRKHDFTLSSPIDEQFCQIPVTNIKIKRRFGLQH